MISPLKVLSKESIVSIRDLQKNPSASLKDITRITKAGKTIGFFFSLKEIHKMFAREERGESPTLEELEAAYTHGEIIDD